MTGSSTGDETCDDGVNDDSYDGCTPQCGFAAFCGDGEVNGDEACDEGDANENGSGCNVDCVVSGSVIGEYHDEGFSFCEGASITRPVFRDDGNAIVSHRRRVRQRLTDESSRSTPTSRSSRTTPRACSFPSPTSTS